MRIVPFAMRSAAGNKNYNQKQEKSITERRGKKRKVSRKKSYKHNINMSIIEELWKDDRNLRCREEKEETETSKRKK